MIPLFESPEQIDTEEGRYLLDRAIFEQLGFKLSQRDGYMTMINPDGSPCSGFIHTPNPDYAWRRFVSVMKRYSYNPKMAQHLVETSDNVQFVIIEYTPNKHRWGCIIGWADTADNTWFYHAKLSIAVGVAWLMHYRPGLVGGEFKPNER